MKFNSRLSVTHQVLRLPLLIIILSIALSILFCSCGKQSSEKTDHTEILWDTWGVPHIFARDATGLFYAYGWSQMESHGNLILRLYGQARGRAAEYWGESYRESDRYIHTLGVPGRARLWYKAQNQTIKEYLDAFAEGVNAYAESHSENLADEVKCVLPVKPECSNSSLIGPAIKQQGFAGIGRPFFIWRKTDFQPYFQPLQQKLRLFPLKLEVLLLKN